MSNFREFWLEFDRGRWSATYTEKVDGLNEDAIHVIDHAALESAIADAEKAQQSLMKCVEILEDKNKKLSDEILKLVKENTSLQIQLEQAPVLAKLADNPHTGSSFDEFKMQQELEYYKEMESRYNLLLEETNTQRMFELQDENKKLSEQLVICDRAIESLANDRTEAYEIIDKLEAALNKIGMLGMSEHAYTSEFTERVRSIIAEALK